MHRKFSTATAAATILLGLAALSTPAMAGSVIYQEQPLTVGANYLEPAGGTNGFAVKAGNTYYIDFTLPATESLLSAYADIVQIVPNFTDATFNLYKGDAAFCGANVCGVGSLVTPNQVLASLNTKVYDLGPQKTGENFVLEVIPTNTGTLQGSIQIGGVPEPATWAMMILGVGMIGFAGRRRRAGAAPALA